MVVKVFFTVNKTDQWRNGFQESEAGPPARTANTSASACTSRPACPRARACEIRSPTSPWLECWSFLNKMDWLELSSSSVCISQFTRLLSKRKFLYQELLGRCGVPIECNKELISNIIVMVQLQYSTFLSNNRFGLTNHHILHKTKTFLKSWNWFENKLNHFNSCLRNVLIGW